MPDLARRRDPMTRFLKFVGRDRGSGTCLEWIGHRSADGYGRFWFNGKQRQAHRVIWELVNGPLSDGEVLRHVICDNPPCVRLSHLAPGTSADNVADRVGKNRSAAGDRNGARTHPERWRRGTENPAAKLNPENVRTIRQQHALGQGYGRLAKRFGVTKRAIYLIVLRRTWRHVGEEVA